jgi:hypothetical protein
MTNKRATLRWHAQRGRHSPSSTCQCQQYTQCCSTGATLAFHYANLMSHTAFGQSLAGVSLLYQHRRNDINLCAEHTTWLYCNTSAACEATCVSTHPGLHCQALDKATRHEQTPRQFQNHKRSLDLQSIQSCTTSPIKRLCSKLQRTKTQCYQAPHNVLASARSPACLLPDRKPYAGTPPHMHERPQAAATPRLQQEPHPHATGLD